MGKEYWIIADAGGTKTEWNIIDMARKKSVLIKSGPINASVSSSQEILNGLNNVSDYIDRLTADERDLSLKVAFYGAGCNSSTVNERIKTAFYEKFKDIKLRISVKSDITGAAEALFGHEKGIACILGTGSASCLYDGEKIIDSVPSLGFILGDEGSGAFMGRMLLNAYFKRDLSKEVKCKLEKIAGMELSDVIQQIYRAPGANKYLASFIPFIKENEDDSSISVIIFESLKLFFQKNVLKYKPLCDTNVRFVGGVAVAFEKQINEIAVACNLNADKFLRNPIEELGSKYLNNEIEE